MICNWCSLTMVKTELKRSLSLPLITFYGLGNILGAGIYVLVGKVAGTAGVYAPVAFIVASLIATLTAFCYAELTSRYPLSAGESVYIHEGFNRQWLSLTVGLLISLAAIVSAATIINGFVGYLQVFIPIPDIPATIGIVLIIGGIALLGIKHAVGTAAVLTLIEIAGLLIVIFVGADHIFVNGAVTQILPPTDLAIWPGIFAGAFLAFYAFLGFEDMVNVAEEVKNPQRNMPIAIFTALAIASLFYFTVTYVSISVLSPEQLSQSKAPLSSVYETATGRTPVLITVISMFAIINGALIQVIMVSRILYGMSRQGWLPDKFSSLSQHNGTPSFNTVVVTLIVLFFALWLPLIALAKLTSFIILIVFALVNLSLYFIKRKHPVYEGKINYPIWLPIAGTAASLLLITAEFL